MKNRFSIEVTTGVITRSIQRTNVDSTINNILTARDVMDCEVVFTSRGEEITPEILPSGSELRLGLRASLSEGALLAQSEPHTMVDGRAECVFSLNTAAIVALVAALPSSARTTNVYLEAEVSGPGDRRDTYAQQRVTMRCEVNMEEDEPPAPHPVGALLRTAVDFPTSSATAGAAGQYAINGDELAIYVPGVGFRKITLLGW